MKRVVGQTFEDTTVLVDGTIYERCVFRRCVLRFIASPEGGGFLSNTFDDCTWNFGEAAARTIEFMKLMVTHLNYRDVVEQTCREILGGGPPAAGTPNGGVRLDA
jgi:hypothetical protein